MMSITEIEGAIVDRLAPLSALGYRVSISPDTQSAAERRTRGTIVYVALKRTYFGSTNSPGRPEVLQLGAGIAQEEFIELDVYVESPKLHTEKGLYDVLTKVQRQLFGWRPPFSSAPILLLDVTLDKLEEGYFSFTLTILASRLIVANVDPETGEIASLNPETGEYDLPVPDQPPGLLIDPRFNTILE